MNIAVMQLMAVREMGRNLFLLAFKRAPPGEINLWAKYILTLFQPPLYGVRDSHGEPYNFNTHTHHLQATAVEKLVHSATNQSHTTHVVRSWKWFSSLPPGSYFTKFAGGGCWTNSLNSSVCRSRTIGGVPLSGTEEIQLEKDLFNYLLIMCLELWFA